MNMCSCVRSEAGGKRQSPVAARKPPFKGYCMHFHCPVESLLEPDLFAYWPGGCTIAPLRASCARLS